MKVRFSLTQMLGSVMGACVVAALFSYKSPALVAIAVDFLAVYVSLGEPLAKRVGWDCGYVRSPKNALDWIVLLLVVMLINAAAFGPVRISR